MKIFRSQQHQDEYEYSLFSNSKTKITLEEYIDIKRSIGNSPYWLLKSKRKSIILFIEEKKGWLIARNDGFYNLMQSSNFVSIKTLNYWTELYKKGKL